MDDLMEMELATLACMASAPRVADQVLTILEPTDFTTDNHAIVFSTMRHMVNDGEHIDELTLPAEIRKDGHGDSVVAIANRLYAVASNLVSVDAGVEYARVLREESVRRTLIFTLDGVLRRGGDIEAVVSEVEAAVFDARSRIEGKGSLREMTGSSLLSPLDAFLSAPQGQDGYPYPLPSMRQQYGLYEKGRLTYLAGGSGDGKTTMAFQWVEELCEAGARVCVYELEMTELQVSRLLVMQGAGLTPRQAKGIDPLSMEDLERYENRKRIVSAWDLTVKCGPVLPTQIRADQMRERYDVIVVDHMQKFERTQAGEYADITRYSSQLHRITRDLDCSVIVLAQLKKATADHTGRTRRRVPTTGDMRGAGGMEEDADDVLLMWNDRDHDDRRTGTGALLVGKMRDGEPDKVVPLKFIGERVKFFEQGQDVTAKSVLSRRQEAF